MFLACFRNFPLSQLNIIRCSFQDGRFCSFLKPVLENFAWPLFYRLISKGRVKFSGLSSAEYPMVPSCIRKAREIFHPQQNAKFFGNLLSLRADFKAHLFLSTADM